MIKKEVVALKFVLGLTGLLLAACASNVHKADIPNTSNPQEEISKLGADIQGAIAKNIDVLAPTYFKKSVKSFDEAKSDLAKGAKQEEILDDVRTGRGSLEKAYSESEGHEALAPTLFAARQAALVAGAATHPELEKDLRKTDSDTSSQAEDLAKATSEKLSALQARYISLERRSVILNHLGKAQGIVTGAKSDGAGKRAPQTLKKAELSLKNAESSIETNVRNPEGFSTAVTEANNDASLLMDVVTTIKQNGKNLPEATALKLVMQNRQIGNLESNLSSTAAKGVAAQNAFDKQSALTTDELKAKDLQLDSKNQQLDTQTAALAATGMQLSAADQELASKTNELQSKGQALDSANAKVEIQRAIEKARSEFSPNDAEAYQQGGNLLIRLKNVGFATGRSDLPAASLSLLAKVSEVAKSLNASEIKVEGHTDSVGSVTQNKAISNARANAVATYFRSNGFNKIDVQSQGFGFEKPIATNKSKEGRAQNRRVDIVITPEVQ